VRMNRGQSVRRLRCLRQSHPHARPENCNGSRGR
jgi:hypothetical protein